MKRSINRETHRLLLSSETLRRLTVPELGRAQGGLTTRSYCAPDFDDNTRRIATNADSLCANPTGKYTGGSPTGCI
jgi:hypothetical protein